MVCVYRWRHLEESREKAHLLGSNSKHLNESQAEIKASECFLYTCMYGESRFRRFLLHGWHHLSPTWLDRDGKAVFWLVFWLHAQPVCTKSKSIWCCGCNYTNLMFPSQWVNSPRFIPFSEIVIVSEVSTQFFNKEVCITAWLLVERCCSCRTE